MIITKYDTNTRSINILFYFSQVNVIPTLSKHTLYRICFIQTSNPGLSKTIFFQDEHSTVFFWTQRINYMMSATTMYENLP